MTWEGHPILMMELSAALGYADKALRDTMDYGKGSLVWLQRNDVLARGKMATLVRRGTPAGVALGEAVREAHLEWRSRSIQPAMESPHTPPTKRPLSARSRVARRFVSRSTTAVDVPMPSAPTFTHVTIGWTVVPPV